MTLEAYGILSNRSSGSPSRAFVRAALGDPMTEILTESFCERCGTRYTFESARPRARLKGVKVLSRGLKNFVLSDDASMDEAMATARNESDRDATSQQLDAFHKTFNFCMSCRQYTCPNCWNQAEARCLTCAPNLGHDVMPAPFPDLPPAGYSMTGANGSNGSNGTAHDPWPIEAEAAAIAGPSGPAEDEFDVAGRLDALVAHEPATIEAVKATAAVEVPAPAEVEAVAEVQGEAEAPEVGAPLVADATLEAEPTVEILAPAGPTSEVEAPAQSQAEPEPNARVSSLPESWIVKDGAAETDALSAPAAITEPEPTPEVQLAATEPDPTPEVGAAAAEPEPAPEVPAAAEAETAATDDDSDSEVAARLAAMAAATIVIDDAEAERPRPKGQKAAGAGGLLRRFRAGQSLDSELDAYERQEAAAIAEASSVETTVPEVAAAPTETPIDPALAEPVVAVAAEPPVALEPEPVVDDVVAQPTWRIVAPDPAAEPVEDTPPLPAAATSVPGAEPQWPQRPEGTPSTGLPFLNRPAAAQGGLEALWAESNREVVTTPGAPGKAASGGVQPCVSCGLSLSGTARFCRRCGTLQAS